MALLRKPHLIIVTRPIDDENSGYEEVYRFYGQITIRTADESQKIFGMSVSNPAVCMGDIKDGGERNNPNIRVGDRVEAIGFKWNVKTPVEFHEASYLASHIKFLLDRNLPDSIENENV